MKVFKTQLQGYNGPCVVHEPESVIDELRRVLPEMAAGDSFTVTVAEMDEKNTRICQNSWGIDMTELHSTTAAVLKAIKTFWAEEGYSPSIRDIADATGITSTSVVRYHIDKLGRAGNIRRTPRVARSYVLIEKGVKDAPTIP